MNYFKILTVSIFFLHMIAYATGVDGVEDRQDLGDDQNSVFFCNPHLCHSKVDPLYSPTKTPLRGGLVGAESTLLSCARGGEYKEYSRSCLALLRSGNLTSYNAGKYAVIVSANLETSIKSTSSYLHFSRNHIIISRSKKSQLYTAQTLSGHQLLVDTLHKRIYSGDATIVITAQAFTNFEGSLLEIFFVDKPVF